METSTLTQRELANFNNLADVFLLSAASAGRVSVSDILSSKKAKEITIARGVAIRLMHNEGLPIREVARITNTDPKGVHTYVHQHDERMEDTRYKRVFEQAREYAVGYYSSDANLRSEVDALRKAFIALDSKCEHIKELILNN